MTRLWGGRRRNRDSISGRNKACFSFLHGQIGSGANPTATGSSFPEIKRPAHEADHSFPTTAEVKNVWSYTFNSSYVLMALCLEIRLILPRLTPQRKIVVLAVFWYQTESEVTEFMLVASCGRWTLPRYPVNGGLGEAQSWPWSGGGNLTFVSQLITRHFFKSYPCNRPWRPIGLWDVEVPTFSRQPAHRWRWGCQPYAPAAL
jgi:hypothetical protein